ncbi:siderophore yersiniabactin receptor FyuA [Klebsiella pneumoniae]|uniref:siderophore yersiniabactin receptor FyuA n=1 Tax=Klebsiella pneumoniae TaxID=573 RepID=UPI000E2DE679|nr:siderophore yersiniabactin receptor FyuA [Klebsiella pneumoniae]SVM67285.1 Yersiniabactin/pesticin outer membrane receptor (IRPC) [Klebsiella pneumoniae]VTM02183.1 Yersiniabactin/pesticin outer membrane receptor (IRPC) [Klebsiella pneumoniae]HBQ1984122.1 siderophore yersiniabactin receptor FyuA [Klebsiella pneumoniae]HBR4244208.1 siderophore yersiniabactin receptor FyuA [Klebsiella pneumoniae]HCF6516123.1 siderophore yersiniabactin receptor FyuA [Klebsiella pneumoniae]
MKMTRLYPLALGGLLLPAIANAQTSQQDESTLVVTASKQSSRSASANNVSSTVVSAPELSDAGVTASDKLPRVLPGLNIENSGSMLFSTASLRGVTSAQDFYNPAVTLYVDGVPQLSTNTIQALTDVQSVELLRGPQGTLYGKSAQGGIINIVTQQPDSTPRGYIEGGVSSRDSYRSKFNLTGPIQDGLLYGSVTLLRQVEDGDMINPATGSDDLGGTRASIGNVKLRLAPDEQPWEMGFSASRECTRATQDAYVSWNDIKSRKLSISDGLPDPYMRRCTDSQTLSGKYTTDDWVFNLISAWQQQHYSRTYPSGSLIVNMPQRWNQDVQELRAATLGDARTVDMVFGLYRQNTREKVNTAYDMPTGPYLSSTGYTTAETLAAYSDLTWHLTDRFDIGGGVRFSHDKASTQYHGNMLGNPFGDQGKINDDQVLGQLSAGYMLTDDWRVYTRVAQGYKPSGYNIVPTAGLDAKPFVAEKSINYELGTRYETADVTLQAATFYTHTKDMQLYSGPVGMQTLSNAGKADATGVELEAKWRFAPGWSWDINGNVIRSEFTNDSELYHGNRVPFVPRYGAGSSVNGVIDTRYGALMPRLAINLVGPHYFDGDNQLRQGTYATLDSSLGWQATERMNISVYVDNLFDRRYRTYGYMNGSSAVAQVNMGRTVGINTRIDFF